MKVRGNLLYCKSSSGALHVIWLIRMDLLEIAVCTFIWSLTKISGRTREKSSPLWFSYNMFIQMEQLLELSLENSTQLLKLSYSFPNVWRSGTVAVLGTRCLMLSRLSFFFFRCLPIRLWMSSLFPAGLHLNQTDAYARMLFQPELRFSSKRKHFHDNVEKKKERFLSEDLFFLVRGSQHTSDR